MYAHNLKIMLPLFPYAKYFNILTKAVGQACKYSTKSHYESLGVTPKATQLEIKSAYYNLSKVYHPDVTKGQEDTHEKFVAITEAYEVLGNVKSRKLYDRGMLPNLRVHSETDPTTRFYKSREIRHRPPPPPGSKPIYDFDEWSKNHYEETFTLDMQIKRRREMSRMMEMHQERARSGERALAALIAILVMFFYLTKDDGNDRITYERSNDIKLDKKVDK